MAGPGPRRCSPGGSVDWVVVRRQGMVHPHTRPPPPSSPQKAKSHRAAGRLTVCPSSAVEMAASKHPGALQKLKERLCRETEPSKLYKTLKKLSSLPMLADTLEEIGFRQTIKLLRKQQLLVPYAKALAAQWSEKSRCEPQPMTELLGTCGEDRPQGSSTTELRGEDEGEKPPSRKSKSEAGPEKQSLPPLHPKSPGRRVQAASFEECLNYDSPPSSALQPPRKPRLLPCKRKRKNSWEAELQSPRAKAPLGGSGGCQNRDLLAEACALPKVAPRPQDGFQVPEPELSLVPSHQEESPSWACRKKAKTPVYSGRPRPTQSSSGAPLQQSQPGVLAECHSAGGWHCPPCREESEPRPPEQGSRSHTHTGKTPHSQSATKGPLQGQDSGRQVRLQALVARLQSTEAKKPRVHQAKRIAILARPKIPDPQEASGPRGAASLEKHSRPEASAQSQEKGAPCLSLGDSNKSKAQKPAPLMAKALKAYNHRFYRFSGS